MNQNKKISLIFLILWCSVTLTSCGSVSSEGGGWPITSYYNACDLPRFEPMEPGCLSNYRQFLSQAEFSSCKQSVWNYVQAIQDYQSCAIDFINNRFREYQKQTNETFKCLERELPVQFTSEQLPNTCIPVSVNIDNLQILNSFDVPPVCISKKEFFPKYQEAYRFTECKEEVKKYNNVMRQNINSSAYSLQSKLQFKANDAVRRFNAMANL